MNNLKQDDKVIIHSYKHDGSMHRIWKNSTVIKETEDVLIIYNSRTKVIESSGRVWYSKEPAIVYFFKNQWFNIISMLRKEGIFYYCNISSPYLYDGEAVKYIDYDLDLKVFPDFSYKILDRNEFKYHSNLMEYPKELIKILEEELKTLISWVNNRKQPFIHEVVKKEYESYKIRNKINIKKVNKREGD